MLVLAALVLYLLWQGGHFLLFKLYLTWEIFCLFLAIWVKWIRDD